MDEGWKDWEGKRVFIILKNKRVYTGEVLEVEGNYPLCWITINDKFNQKIGFCTDEIEVIQEEKE